MTSESVHYSVQNQVATIRIDDGKRNALSPQVLREIYQALDRAEADGAIVILTGRESVFSPAWLRPHRPRPVLSFPCHRRLQWPLDGDGCLPDVVG